MLHKLRRLLRGLWERKPLRVSFPEAERCLVCGRLLPPLLVIPVCGRCFAGIPRPGGPVCRLCGRPVRAEGLCLQCRQTSVHYLTLARSFALYEGVVQEWLHTLKYRGQWEIGVVLGKLMALHLADYPELQADCVVPVPLHPDRLHRRGFNQAALLAVEVARRQAVGCLDGAVARVRPTRAQAGLAEPQRRSNIRGAFRVVEPAAVRGRRVLVVDDIYTTGATLHEMGRALLRAGAREVKGYCCAITMYDKDLAAETGNSKDSS